MSGEFLRNMNVSKMGVFDENSSFSQILFIGTYERLHAGPQDSFERMKLEQRRAAQKQPSSQNAKKAISVNPPSANTNSQQTQKKINLETPGKAISKINFAKTFS